MDVLKQADVENRREDRQCIKDHIVNMEDRDQANVGGVRRNLDLSK